MDIKTHNKISQNLCGTPIKLENEYCLVELKTSECMVADEAGLVHGGFIFGAADYAAMLAVNHQNVVLGSANVKFCSPVKMGNVIKFEATVKEKEAIKRIVEVIGYDGDSKVFSGEFICYILEKHVLEAKK